MADRKSKRQPGMAGLSREQIEAFGAGGLGLEDLAARAGVTKQAASRWLRRRGLGRGSAATPLPTATEELPASPPHAGATASTAELHPALAGFAPDQDELRRLAVGTGIAALVRANGLLSSPSPLGASQVKAAIAAASAAAEVLGRLGVLPLTFENERTPAELRVVRMTEKEEQEIRDAADANAAEAGVNLDEAE